MDRDARGAISRAAGVVYCKEQIVPAPVFAEIFYLFTCEYCFSHYVTAVFLLITRYTLLFDGWRGYLIAGFSLVWLANVYMNFFGRLRLEIREDRLAVASEESRATVLPTENKTLS